MRLTDIMSGANLTIWPQLALGLFIVAFAAIAIREWMRNRDEIRHASEMPLHDDDAAAPVRTPGGLES